MSGWRWTRAHPLHMEVFRFVDDIQGVRVDRVGGGGERVAVGSQRPQGLCGQDEDMDQWTSGLALMEAIVTLMRLNLVGLGRRGAGNLC